MARAVKKADSEARKREAFKLNEELRDYFLSWALDGEFYIDAMNEAAAAFSLADVEKLRELCDEYRTECNFVEPDEALKAHLPKMEPVKLKSGKTRKFRMEDFTVEHRIRILPTVPGTRAYARVQIEAQGGGTPFDA